jgi:DNA/RNA-binding domain of Phe-tRNA-synthetase-like protein
MTESVQVHPTLRSTFPGVRVAWFVAEDAGKMAACPQARHLVDQVQTEISARGLSPEQIGQLPLIAPWRSAFSKQGIKPSQYRSSADALLRRFAANKYTPVGIEIVDIYNALSVHHQVPMGAYDRKKLASTQIDLRFGKPDDSFSPLGGSADNYFLNERVPVYAVGSTVICWAFNHRDSRETCVDAETQSALFMADAIDQSQYESQTRAINHLRSLFADASVGVSEISYSDRRS